MSTTIKMPMLGGLGSIVVLSHWFKKIGDRVEVGDAVVQVKVDGHTKELEAFDYGMLTEVFVAEGQRLEAGQELAVLTPWPCPSPETAVLGGMTRTLAIVYPEEGKLSLDAFFHFIGWLAALIATWNITSRIDSFLRDYSPTWVHWSVGWIFLAIALGISAFFLFYGIKKLEGPRKPNGRAEVEAWFRTIWADEQPVCRITDVETTWVRTGWGPPDTSRIRISDGHGFIVMLYHDLQTKKIVGCRAYPAPESFSKEREDRSGVEQTESSPGINNIIDPTAPGPFDRCLRCFTPKSEEVSYCPKCGSLNSFFEIANNPHGMNCVYHQDRTAHAYCACCAKPICPACEGRRGRSLLGGFETPQCRNCLETMARIEKEFLARLDRGRSCAKHPNERARLRCKSCGLFHCDYCLYFVTKGIVRKKIADGPYCLGCFRLKIEGATRRRWVSVSTIPNRNVMKSPGD